jgi:tetratricopeptide (TPR) repeat protein
VWHATIKKLAPKNLAVLGVVQEQHAERTKLYKQWKQYDFPIAQDSVTKLGAAVVPIFIGIDEHGIVQSTKLRPENLKAFLNKTFDPPANEAAKLAKDIDYSALASKDGSTENLCFLGDQEMLFRVSESKSYDNAIESYRSALKKDPNNGTILFRLGAAYRQRYDEHSHDDADFDMASKYWTMALDSNPRQYIWRRRIEQYGPRLQKPYPFYDWVDTAITEIKQRGEVPVELTVALTQSELAGRSKPDYSKRDTMPELTEKIERDQGQFISIESTMVPGFVKSGKPATVHLRFVPSGAKWNNESTPLTVWVESESAKLSQQLLTHTVPDEANSKEDRSFEFDLLPSDDNGDGSIIGFALYNVCTEEGVCMVRRQDFKIDVPRAAAASE